MLLEPALRPDLGALLGDLDRRLAILERRAGAGAGGGGQGLAWRAANASDVTLSTTAGTYTDVVTLASIALTQGRLYQVTFTGGYDMFAGGSGFAVTDRWEMKLLRNTGSGDTQFDLWVWAKAFVANSFRYPMMTRVAYFSPAASGNVSFKAAATKAVGASTVTTLLETSSGASPFQLFVDDVGPAGSALN